MDSAESAGNSLTDLTADIASAYLRNNTIRPDEIPTLISTIYTALSGMGAPQSAPAIKAEPTMPWKKAIKPDYIISFREKWSLPRDFPMVAPEYAARRSEMAK